MIYKWFKRRQKRKQIHDYQQGVKYVCNCISKGDTLKQIENDLFYFYCLKNMYKFLGATDTFEKYRRGEFCLLSQHH